MLDKLQGPTKIVASIFFFPMLFQGFFLDYAWGGQDDWLIASAKRIFILLPVLAIIFACWMTIVCALTIVVRHERRKFMAAIFVTWWDLGRSIFAYWGGLLKFLWQCLGYTLALLRVTIFTFLLILKDIMMIPIRLVGDLSHGYLRPGIPWPAIALMLGWALLEAVVFTYVMTPLVTDVLSGLAGEELQGPALQIPLFLMFVVFVLGSYAVLHSLGLAVKEKNVSKIVNNVIIEVIVAMVEVVFLYREFVDALMPWFAQHAGGDFELGIFGTLAIAGFAWTGIRAMTWFLFGASAIPTLMAIIQRTGFEQEAKKGILDGLRRGSSDDSPRVILAYIDATLDKVKKDIDWFHSAGDQMLSSFIVPPMQIVAASINFCTLLISNSHLFELPFKSFKDILEARMLLLSAKKAVSEDG